MIPSADIPDITLQYWSITHTDIPLGMYGLDQRRAEYHEEMCKYYGITKEQSKSITDNMDKIEWVYDLHNKLDNLPKQKEKQ